MFKRLAVAEKRLSNVYKYVNSNRTEGQVIRSCQDSLFIVKVQKFNFDGNEIINWKIGKLKCWT